MNSSNFFNVGFYFRRGVANFQTDPLNALSYADDVNSAQASNQKRTAYSGGFRLDHTWVPNTKHLVKGGVQFDYSRANNGTQIFAFDTNGGAPAGPVISRERPIKTSKRDRNSGCRPSGLSTTTGHSTWVCGVMRSKDFTMKARSVHVSA